MRNVMGSCESERGEMHLIIARFMRESERVEI